MYKTNVAVYTSCMGRMNLLFHKFLSICDVAGLYVVSANSELVCSFSNRRVVFFCTMMAVAEYKHANFRQAKTVVQPLTAISRVVYIGHPSTYGQFPAKPQQWRAEGGFWVFKPPPPEIPKISVESSIA